MAQTDRFLSCDWGTTAFRLRLVEADGFKIIAETSSTQGNKDLHAEWSKSGRPEVERVAFYRAVLGENIQKLEAGGAGPLDGVPVIISGMASSTVGMMELPYKEVPFALDGSDLRTKQIPPDDAFPWPVLLISGAATADDVMRGEETQIVGCAIANTPDEQMLIHPGTHAKHAVIRNGQVVSFRTFMTGEIFSLLSTQSILASGVEECEDTRENQVHFVQGVEEGAADSLLHILFTVRTAGLFGKRSKGDNYHYLSGLLIGHELSAFPAGYAGTIILAGNDALRAKYKRAMDALGISQKAKGLIEKDDDAITIAGQYAVYSRHF